MIRKPFFLLMAFTILPGGCLFGCSGPPAPVSDTAKGDSNNRTNPKDITVNCDVVPCEHAPICGRLNQAYGCCVCEPGSQTCVVYDDILIRITCRSDGLCFMPEACPAGGECKETGPTTASCGEAEVSPDVLDGSDASNLCAPPCTETPLCTDPNKPLCDCPCTPEQDHCSNLGEEQLARVCSEDMTCFEEEVCFPNHLCDLTEEGPECVPDPNALPPCRVDCVPPPLCGEEPENSNCPICECTDGDTFCDNNLSPAVLSTCQQGGNCVNVTPCPAGDPCIYASPQNGQCLSQIDDCSTISNAYLYAIAANQSCDLDAQCVYQVGRCDMGYDQCYYGIRWESLDLLSNVVSTFIEKDCPPSPPCTGCGPEPTGGVCEAGQCVILPAAP